MYLFSSIIIFHLNFELTPYFLENDEYISVINHKTFHDHDPITFFRKTNFTWALLFILSSVGLLTFSNNWIWIERSWDYTESLHDNQSSILEHKIVVSMPSNSVKLYSWVYFYGLGQDHNT